MSKKVKAIMLIDDNSDDNFFHARVIKKNQFAETVITMTSATEALSYLKNATEETVMPDLIFLDINMPGMNGWEFLDEYNKIMDPTKNSLVVTMLTTSDNPDDKARAKDWKFVSDFITKPLTKEMMEKILAAHDFNNRENS